MMKFRCAACHSKSDLLYKKFGSSPSLMVPAVQEKAKPKDLEVELFRLPWYRIKDYLDVASLNCYTAVGFETYMIVQDVDDPWTCPHWRIVHRRRTGFRLRQAQLLVVESTARLVLRAWNHAAAYLSGRV